MSGSAFPGGPFLRRLAERLPPWVPPALLLLAAALLYGGRALFSGGAVVLSGAENDLASQFAAWREFGFRELGRGNLALWNPHVFCGAPFFGAFESALLYPPNWVHLVLSLGNALNAVIVSHVLLAGLLAFAWCRRRGLGQDSSLLAGLMYMLSGPVILHAYAGHLPPLCAMAWAPGVFLALEAIALDSKPAWFALGAAAVAMQVLAGNPQYVYYTALAALLVSAGSAVSSRKAAPLFGFAAVYAGGAAIGAVQLLAGWQAAGESVRAGGLPYDYAASFSLPPENLLTLAAPWLFGDTGRFPYFGRLYLWEASLFVSLTGLVLALGAPRGGDKRSWRMPAAMAAATLVLALGARLPLYKLMHACLPGYDLFRGTAKFSFLTALFLSLLAAAGFERLKKAPPSRLFAGAVLALGLGMMVAASRLAASSARPDSAWAGWLSAMERTGEVYPTPGRLGGDAKFTEHAADFAAKQLFDAAWVAAALAALLFAVRSSPKAANGILLLAALELLAFGFRGRGRMSVRMDYPDRWLSVLKADPGDYRVLHDWGVHPNAAMRLGLYDVMGYSQLSLKRHAELIAASQGADPNRPERYPVIERIPPVFRMLRLRYDLRDARAPPKRLPGALPRLVLVREWKSIPDRDRRLKALFDPSFDPSRKVILETEPVPAPKAPAAATPPLGRAEVVRSGTDELEIEAELAGPAILLITDNYSAGWKAKVRPESGPKATPGTSYPILRANHSLMAVPLGPGRHAITLEYRPAAFTAGLWISLISLAGFALLVVRTGLQALKAGGESLP